MAMLVAIPAVYAFARVRFRARGALAFYTLLMQMAPPMGLLLPFCNVLAQTPLMIWHPDHGAPGGRTSALTSAVDLYATILEALGASPTPDVHSRSLIPLLTGEQDTHRDWVISGYWGSSFHVCDGRYTYFHPCDPDVPAESHSTMMLLMAPWDWFMPPRPHYDADAGAFLPYTESPVWRYTVPSQWRHDKPMLFDVDADPGQLNDLAGSGDPNEDRMRDLLIEVLDAMRAPESQYARLHLRP